MRRRFARQGNGVRESVDNRQMTAYREDDQEVGLFPGWRLHPLKGDLKGFWSVTITGNWRLIFRFEDGDAFDLDLVDYH